MADILFSEEKNPEIGLDSSFDVLKGDPKYFKLFEKIKVLSPQQQTAALSYALKCHNKAKRSNNSSGKPVLKVNGSIHDNGQVITSSTGTTISTVPYDGSGKVVDNSKDFTILEERDIVDHELLDAVCVGQVEKLHSLRIKFRKSANDLICAKNEKDGHPMLHWAALEDQLQILQYIFSEIGSAGIDKTNVRGETALHWACLRGHIRAVNFLIRSGADVNATDDKGYTALHHASQFGHTRIVAQLLRHMARRNLSNIDIRDNGGRTPLHWAAYKHFPSLVRFLILKGADLYCKDFEDLTPLHWAALQGDIDVVQTILWEIKSAPNMVRYLETTETNGKNAFQLADAKGEKFHDKSAEGYRYHHVIVNLKKAHDSAKSGKLLRRGFAGATRSDLVVYDESFTHPIYFGWPITGVLNGYLYLITIAPHIFIYIPMLSFFSTLSLIATWITFLRIQVEDPGFLVCEQVDDLSKKKRFWNYLMFCWSPKGYVKKGSKSNKNSETTELLESGRTFDQQYEEMFPPSCVPNPKEKLSNYYRELYYEILDKGLTAPICTSCEIAKPLRSKHDRFSDKCVSKFDHYCPWVGAPVARGNYFDFFFFCFSMTFLVIFWVINWYYYLKYLDESQTILTNASRWDMLPWVLFTVVPSVPFIAYALVMVVSHMFLINKNMTTNESINRYRYKYIQILDQKGNYENVFSQGFFKNWLEFLGFVEPKKQNFRQFYHKEFEGEKDAFSRIAEAQKAMVRANQNVHGKKLPTLSSLSITTNPSMTIGDVGSQFIPSNKSD